MVGKTFKLMVFRSPGKTIKQYFLKIDYPQYRKVGNVYISFLDIAINIHSWQRLPNPLTTLFLLPYFSG